MSNHRLLAAIREWRVRVPLSQQVSFTLLVVALLTATLVVAIVTYSEYSISRREMQESLHTKARMLAANAQAAVTFQDAKGATEILAALRASPDMRSGRLIMADGSVLASYQSVATSLLQPITVREPVMQQGKPLAQLELTADFSRQRAFLVRYAGLIALVLIIAMLVLRFVFEKALSVLWQPMNQLIEVMHRVSQQGDYSLRSGLTGHNEVGELAHSFDAMLGEIQRREAELDAELVERRRAEQQLAYIAHYDTLTGLPNRHAFNNRMKLVGRDQEPMAVLLIDVDHFKLVNDTLGHFAGDALLQNIAGRLHAAIVQSGIEAVIHRIGGDEFAVVVGGRHAEEDAALLGNRFIDAIASPFNLFGQPVHSSLSIGLAAYPEHGTDTHSLIRHADVALYAAKAQGRKQMCVFHFDMNAGAAESLALESDLRKALLEDALYLLYEPQIDVRSHRLIAAEALVRWQHPTLGAISPQRFIALAERTGLILPLGEWVLRSACVATRRALDQGLCHPDFKVGVNLSPRQLADSKLVETVARVLRDTGLPARNLELEVTESSVVENIELASERMHAMQAMGVTFAMDDFGVGATSLSYLKKLPIAKVKIDRSFVNDLPHDEDDAAIATAIIAMSHKLKMPVLAEGIERPEQLAFLHAHHCDMAQGYMIGLGASLPDLLARPELAATATYDPRTSPVN